MTIWDALLLGAVQGLTEFLPISSSAHLILVPWLLGRPDGGLTFDVALHMGTLLALLVYFWRDWLYLLDGLWSAARGRPDFRLRLIAVLVLATIPAAAVGLVGEDLIAERLRSPILAAVLMAGVAVLFLLAERVATRQRLLKDVRWLDALVVGCAQATALMPGVSRSGSTIVAGLAVGLRRDEAARFSFLLATPVTAGAGLLRLRSLVEGGLPPDERLVFIVGVLTATVVGFAAITWLLGYLRRRSLALFAYYRLALAAAIIVLVVVRGGA